MNSSASHPIRLHVHDLMFAMPITGMEVLDSVGLEQVGTVDEPGLFGAGVVQKELVFQKLTWVGSWKTPGCRCWGPGPALAPVRWTSPRFVGAGKGLQGFGELSG